MPRRHRPRPSPAASLRVGLAVLIAATSASPLAAAPAEDQPSLWERATLDGEAAARKERYVGAMSLGFELGRVALALDLRRGGDDPPTAVERARATRQGLQAFRDAAQIDPTAADPHLYSALLIIYGRLDCDELCSFEPGEAKQALAEIKEFERLAPLDPRLTPNLLIKQAIYETRLAGLTKGEQSRGHLQAALVTYRSILERNPITRAQDIIYGNLAETLMMLGDVESAIEQYRQAVKARPSTSVTLGLAVALDRDERGTEARTLLRELGVQSLAEWERQVNDGDIFYVPDGEIFYYRGLINEALGQPAAAIANYNRFLASNAHPQFAARALANRDALQRSASK